MRTALAAVFLAMAVLPGVATGAQPVADAQAIRMTWAVKVPLRDGVMLNATVYRPKAETPPSPCIFTLTPYVSDTYHERGRYFAAHGLPFLTVDVRGRGNSGGSFTPNLQEVNDGYDVVEWLAKQPWCNGKVAMWGGSYAGFDQWATAKNRPPHLATIVPAAAAHIGTDFPWRNNIGNQYVFQWLTYVAGRAGQVNIFGDQAFWAGQWRDRFVAGEPFSNLEHQLGGDQPTLREWIRHPAPDAYFDSFAPTPADYSAMDIPILHITGSYDDDQPGAMTYYNAIMRHGTPAEQARQFLVIGPWDHAGTRTPRQSVGGVAFGPGALLDLPALHVEWYRWTMAGGPKPAFLQKPVAYYVIGADRWQYADSLAGVTRAAVPLRLGSDRNADRLAAPGSLAARATGSAVADHYVYDPRDVSNADLETTIDATDPAETRMLVANDGKQLVYETGQCRAAFEVSGFFKLSAWIAIDQPDTDFIVSVHEVTAAGQSILLSTDIQRARYRQDIRKAMLVTTRAPLPYVFNRFTFMSRQVAAGSRLRLVIGPINSIHTQKNYNSGKPVSDESMADARPVTVTLLHDKAHPSALSVPLGQTATTMPCDG